jgi:DNA-binding transcriptional MerR regulator
MSQILTASRVAAELDIPSETLRYWERAGLIGPVGRDERRRRVYAPSDLDYINVVRCLRATGMPIRDVRRFTQLVHGGVDTIPERLAILRTHASAVRTAMEQQRAAFAIVVEKIATYQKTP